MKKMKKVLMVILVLALALTLAACGGGDKTPADNPGVDKAPSGIADDGIGQVVPLTEEEVSYIRAQNTSDWLAMSADEKDELVVLIGRWMEQVFAEVIVEDYDEMIAMLDHQMEQYAKNGVEANVVATVGELYNVALPLDDNPTLMEDETPSGINDDGIGDDPSFGEGIGEVVALTPEEESYMLAQTTNTWLEMTAQEKDDLVVLIGRTLEATNGYIVADYDDLVTMLDRQMEQYFKNGVDESVLDTVRDIYGIK